MRKYIALRVRNMSDAKAAFRQHQAEIVDASVERKDPALKNLVEGLHDRGLEFSIDGSRVIWFVISDDKDVAYYQQFKEVEVVFSSEWLEERKNTVRYLSGINYCEATNKWAEEFLIKSQERSVDYQVPVELVAA